jgi:uncharacterized phage-like protein YoqJ
MVTGHRSIRDAQARLVREALVKVLAALRARHPEGLVAVSGMAVGADAEFCEACIYLGIPFVAALPVEDQDSVWPRHARERYADQLRRAALVVRVWEEGAAYEATSYGSKMHARNRWMLDQVCEGDGVVLAVWDGRKAGGTWAAVDGALRRGRKVLVLDPRTCGLRVERPAPPPKAFSGFMDLFDGEGPDVVPITAEAAPIGDWTREYGGWTREYGGKEERVKGFFDDALVAGGYVRVQKG